MPYGLNMQTIERICGVFAQHPAVAKAVLYGSRAKGTHKPGSDIDVTLYGDTLTMQELGAIADELDDLLLPYTIDLSLFGNITYTPLKEHIERVGVVLYQQAGKGKASKTCRLAGGAQGTVMKAGWVTKKLGEVCELQRGFDLPKSTRVSGEYPVVSSSGVIDKHNVGPVKCPAIVVGRSGSVGSIFYIDGTQCWPLNTTLFIRDFKNNIPRFIFFLLKSIALIDYAGGTGVPTLNRNVVHQSFVNVTLDKEEQQRIVSILDTAFAAIETAKAHAEANLQNAQEVFNTELSSLFDKKKYLWHELPLNKIGKIQTGSTPKTENQENYGHFIPFIKPSNFTPSGELEYNNFGLSNIGASISRIVRQMSVLMVCIGTLGKCGYNNKNIVTNQQINTLTPFDGFHYKFLYYQMISKRFQNIIRTKASQATLPIVNKSKWESCTLFVPPLSEQQRIVAHLDKLATHCQRLEAIYKEKIALYAVLKQKLLSKAFCDEL